MDIAALDKAELSHWLVSALDTSALGAGRILPTYQLSRGRLSSRSGWQHVGTAESPNITIDSLEAATYSSLGELLRTRPEARTVVAQVDQLLLADAQTTNGGFASSADAALTALGAGALSALMPDFPSYDEPNWLGSPLAPTVFRTAGLAPDELVFIHPCRPATYLLEPIADIATQGPRATIYLRAAIGKPPAANPVPMTRFRIV